MKVNLNKEVIEGLLLEQGCCYLLHDYRELLIEHLRAKKFVLNMKLVTQRDIYHEQRPELDYSLAEANRNKEAVVKAVGGVGGRTGDHGDSR